MLNPQNSRMRPFAILPVLAALVLATPSSSRAQTTASKPLDVSTMDTTCHACDDFFEYANGGWLKRTTIPASYTTYGSFNILADKNSAVLREILESAARDKKAKPGSPTQKLGTFYATCMDSTAASKAGIAPIAGDLEAISRLSSASQIVPLVARLHAAGTPAVFGLSAAPDAKKSTDVIAVVRQGGLTLPDRDYYTKTDDRSVKLRDQYVDHVARTFALAGESASRASSDAQAVLEIETALANASMTRVAMRDPNAVYHRMTFDSLQKLTPRIDWSAYLATRGVSRQAPVNVGQPDFIIAVNGMLRSMPLASWKAYLEWHALDDAAPWLGSKLDAESFRFESLLSGAHEQQPRWKRCLAETNASLGELLGQAYVEKTFTPEAKERALLMVENLQAALRDRLAALSWMSDSTRAQAMTKLTAFTKKIGYPDQWRDYSALEVKRQSFVRNAVAAARWSAARTLAKIGKPVDRKEWGMTPPTVNAYYSPNFNEIVFPAGILQPPFFDPNADDAVNYGGMGAVIGHEMTHGFDDQGRQFDAQGNLRDWWTAGDAAQYKTRAQLVSSQFDAYTVADSVHVNGGLTLGENIADLGGLTIAYAALQKSLENKRVGLIDGFSPDQRFFLAWAQIWRSMARPETERMLVATNPHAPGKWRVNGPLSNMPEFARAFNCQKGDRMVRPESVRAQIW
jgi:putative endopeptidase